MIRFLLRHVAYFLGYTLLGVVAVVFFAYRMILAGMPELSVWHTARLESEFSAADASRVRSLDDYRALEQRLFAELESKVYDRIGLEERRAFSRYTRGSIVDPLVQPVNWNRTFELPVANPRGGALLVHGLSDSPYSMRSLAEHLKARGFHVVGLRLPGHGAAPSGLLDVRWQDMAAAVRIAARDLAQRIGTGKPLYMVGYSTGAALAVEFALARLEGEDLPAVAGLVLVCPAIGVTPAAALAVWQSRAGRMLGIPKLAWNEIVPEYDPYKFNSFTVNAATLVHEISQQNLRRIAALRQSGSAADFPPVLAFQSVADSTVSTAAVIDGLFRGLAAERNELVLFDINRYADAADLYLPGAPQLGQALLAGPPLPFGLTILANADPGTREVAAIRRSASAGDITREATGLTWPFNVFSLSHLALPIRSDDPVYGEARDSGARRPNLGNPQARGERGVLAISPGNLIRLRHNPFFGYMAQRIDRFLGAE